MSKTLDCDRCRYYAHSHFLVCAIHPAGIEEPYCRDFDSAELWEPEDITEYALLGEFQWHPIFTGKCPECCKPFSRLKLPPVHWSCGYCGWEDDTF